MSHKIEKTAPGTWLYRGYFIGDDGHDKQYTFAHEDYDGAPEETGGPPANHRSGAAHTLQAAMGEIDAQIEAAEAAEAGRLMDGYFDGPWRAS